MKIIFLDIDGVCNTYSTKRFLCGYTFVDTRKLLRLRNVVERTGAQLVLSSTWRLADNPINKFCYDMLKAEFERVRCPVWVDCTPHLRGAKRWKEIYAWLSLHPEVEDFIILDDWADELLPYFDKLVQTNPRYGLNKERAELAIKMLGEKENE